MAVSGADTLEEIPFPARFSDRPNGASGNPSVSADGRFVAFETAATNLTFAGRGIVVYDRETGVTEHVAAVSVPVGPQFSPVGLRFDDAPSLSGDGRWVAFRSAASDLVANDFNGVEDIFVYDRQTSAFERVSVDSSGNESNARSSRATISRDGRLVAFESFASNLVAGDTNGASDIFVHDRQIGTTSRVSVDTSGNQSDGDSYDIALSSDGRLVAFSSVATNLVADDTNTDPTDPFVGSDIFVHDRQTGTTERVSLDSNGNQSNGGSTNPALSGDGNLVAFGSAADNLVAGDSNGNPNDGSGTDIFVHDRLTGLTERVSVNSSGAEDNGFSANPAISVDGRFISFFSLASNLVPDDSNGEADIFVRDRQAATTRRVSVDANGNQGDGTSFSPPAISDNGQFIAFRSEAENLVSDDGDGVPDVFVHDSNSGEIEQASIGDPSVPLPADGQMTNSSVSGDGRLVAFQLETDIFVYDRQSQSFELLNADSMGNPGNGSGLSPAVSSDGRFVAFSSDATNLIADDTNTARDVFVRNLATGDIQRVSVDSLGEQGNAPSTNVAINADGNVVVYMSLASNLVENDSNDQVDVFVHDRQTGITERVSVDSNGNQGEDPRVIEDDQRFDFREAPAISADGRFVAFPSSASNLVPNDSNGDRGNPDIFVHDRSSGVTERINVDSEGNESSSGTGSPSISADGQLVAFRSFDANLDFGEDPPLFGANVFVRDRSNGTTRVLTRSGGFGLFDDHLNPKLSANGRFVSFQTFPMSRRSRTIFRHELQSGISDPIAADATAVPGVDLRSTGSGPAINADGSVMVFQGNPSNPPVAFDRFNPPRVLFVREIDAETENDPPVADAGSNQTLECAGLLTPVSLDGSASGDPDGDDLQFAWTGPFDAASGATPTVALPVGVHAIGLTVTDTDGLSDTAATTVTIEDTTAPIIDLGPPVVLVATSPEGAAFTLEPGVTDVCGEVAGVSIEPSLDVFPLGTTTVTVTAEDDAGNSEQSSVTVTVNRDGPEAAPQANIVATTASGFAPMTVRFDGSLSTDDQGIVIYRFDFDDGNGTFSDQSVVEHTYSEPGQYNVVLEAFDAQRNVGVARTTVAVAISESTGSLVSSFSAIPSVGDAPLTVRFDGSASRDDKSIVVYRFDFGDSSGTYSDLSMVEHTYPLPGRYSVALEIIDAQGTTDFTKLTIDVTVADSEPEGSPTAKFTADPVAGDAPLTVQFDGSASSDDAGIAIYRFDFGDSSGTYSEQSKVEHTYSTPGEYNVALEVFDVDGNSDFSIAKIVVSGN